MNANQDGYYNIAMGVSTLASNTSGHNNIALGIETLGLNTIGYKNVALGSSAMYRNTVGNQNVAIGSNALYGSTNSYYNVAIGASARYALGNGSNNNTIIGNLPGTSTLSNTVLIGAGTTERLRIDSNGNVGINTTAPVSLLHINGTPTSGALLTLYDASGTQTATTFAGISFVSPNLGVDFAVGKITETTTSSLGFKAGNTELMRLTSAGSLGIGATPTGDGTSVHVHGSVYATVHLTNTTTGTALGDGSDIVAAGPDFIIRNREVGKISFQTGNAEKMMLTSGGSLGVGLTPSYQLQLSLDSAAKPTSQNWTIASDSRIKNVKGNYTKGLKEICGLQPISYELNGKGGFIADGRDHVSIIAQEAMLVFPECVGTFTARLNPEDVEDTVLYNWNGDAVSFALINAIKELKAEIDSLKDQLNNK
jgi:hypothetical protein